jgi:replication-associated recombination protein RarA
MFIGNAQALSLARQVLSNGRAHAILLVGPDQVGKRTLALELLSEVLGRPYRSNDPAVLVIAPEGTSQRISSEQARRVVRHLAHKPLVGSTSVVLICDADRLTTEAANALLVSLESPPPHARIFLTSDATIAVLPTIRSRCVSIMLGLVSRPVLEKQLASALPGTTSKDHNAVLGLAAGRPGRAVRALTDQGFRQRLETVQLDAKMWLTGSLQQRLVLAQQYGSDPGSARNFLGELALVAQPSQRRNVPQALERLDRNVQARAVLESFAML